MCTSHRPWIVTGVCKTRSGVCYCCVGHECYVKELRRLLLLLLQGHALRLAYVDFFCNYVMSVNRYGRDLCFIKFVQLTLFIIKFIVKIVSVLWSVG